MTKIVNDYILDLSLNEIKNKSAAIRTCIGAPVSYSEATTNYPTGKKSGGSNITGSNFSGPVDNTPTGRKITVNQLTNVPVDVSGTVDHVALIDTVNSILLAVTSLSAPVAVVAGNTMTINSFDFTITDPT